MPGWLAVCLLTLAAPALAQQKPRKPVAPPVPQRPVDNAGAPAVTVNRDGTMSVSAGGLTLMDVLSEIMMRTKLPVSVAPEIQREPVKAVFRDLPFDEGLKRLLAAYDTFYLYSDAKTGAGPVKGVWVFPRGEGRNLQPVPPAAWGSSKELESTLGDPDPGVRMDAYEALLEREGEQGLPTLMRALGDVDDAVRHHALSTAINGGLEVPTTELYGLALTDRSREVRMLALETLDSRPEAEAVAAAVADDADEEIRRTARWMLQKRRTPEPAAADPQREQQPQQ